LIRESIPGVSRMLRVFCTTTAIASSLRYGTDYAIAPHNHSFNLTLHLLYGSAYNVLMTECLDCSCNDYRYPLEVIAGGFKLLDSTGVRLLTKDVTRISQSGCIMNSTDVHTIVADKRSAWLTVENETPVPNPDLYLYSMKPHFKLDDPELYIPMSREELSNFNSQVVLNRTLQIMELEGII
jgi:hypothetical protein